MKTHLTDTYINTFDGTTKAYLLRLRTLILEAVPGAEELINYNIPSISLLKGGKREAQIMFAGYRGHVGFYPHPTTIEHFREQLKDYKNAKGSVQFPITKPLPEDLIIEMVKYRKELISTSKL